MLNRIIGVMKLDANTYEEIEADEGAMGQAITVVAIVAVVGGVVGGGISAAMGGSFLGTLIQSVVMAFLGWIIWSAVTFFVGTSLFGGKGTMGQMLRVLGFAQAPGILAVIPVCGTFIGMIWSLACTVVAIRQGLDLEDTTKAVLTGVIAFVVVLVVYFVIGMILGMLGLGAGATMGAMGCRGRLK